MDVKDRLTAKAGPLPVWGWVVIVIGVGYYVVKRKKGVVADEVGADMTSGDALPQDYTSALISSNYALLNSQGYNTAALGSNTAALGSNTTSINQVMKAGGGLIAPLLPVQRVAPKTAYSGVKPRVQDVKNIGVEYHGWNAMQLKLKAQLAKDPKNKALQDQYKYAYAKASTLYNAYLKAAKSAGVGAT